MHTFNVQGMSCGHCVKAVTQAVTAIDEAAKVDVDLQNGKVTVDSREAPEPLLEAIREEGYTADIA
ncbi:heavy-metal-associated domain-containing protein [Pseudomonas asuensis]|jgi:copper chaperone|uniref:Copper chaperone CopZ n=1 Tax=Pseudomonas asuensis TaxID=1825787 RepID=A0ABQ2GU50_9PSED|nr:cation transporter [Pseudomonas asuensis]GGM12237.1 copper chaperone CopZ [Pseudomonas asuensis]